MRERTLSVSLTLTGLTLLAFGLTLEGTFHFDDYSIFQNPVVVASGSWWRYLEQQTRPLTWLGFRLSYWLSGESPFDWHLTNLILHVASVLTVYHLLRLLLPATNPAPASSIPLIGAALFAVHPMQSEAVAYIFARSNLLMTLLCLLSAVCWIQAANQDRWRWISVGLFALALLAKEECVTFPFFLWMLGYWMRDKSPAKPMFPSNASYWQLGTMLAIAVAVGLRTLVATQQTGTGAGFSAAIGPLQYLASQGQVILGYLGRLVLPFGFSIDPGIGLSVWSMLAGWTVVIAMIALALQALTWKNPRFHFLQGEAFWLLGGFVLLIPSSSVFPASDLVAYRRMYLPMIAFVLVLAMILHRVPKWAQAGTVALLMVVSVGRAQAWKTEESLWREAVEQAPEKMRPRIQLARALPPEQALFQLEEARRLNPADPALDTEFGRVLIQLGHPADALVYLGKALANSPNDAHAYNNRGVALQALGQAEAARQDFERALKIDPCLSDARHNLGVEPCAPGRTSGKRE